MVQDRAALRRVVHGESCATAGPGCAVRPWEDGTDSVDMAVKRVRAMLILETIAAQESLSVGPEEVNDRLKNEAKRQNSTVAELKDQLARKGHLEGLERQLQREKALDFLLDHATISREG